MDKTKAIGWMDQEEGASMILESRDYQDAMINETRQRIREGYRAVLCVLPTGGGKTVIASKIIHGAAALGKRILFLAHRSELVTQCSSKLDTLQVDHGIIMGDHWRRRPFAPVQVASVQTLVNRQMMPPDIIFIDEAHRARAETYGQIIERYPQAVVIGLTATPCRTDGRGLGELFQVMVLGPTVAELVERGYLVPTRVYAPSRPNMKGVKKSGGDWNQQGTQQVMDRPSITGDIVRHWLALGENRITVAFCSGIEHSQHVAEKFLQAGVPAAHLDGTPAMAGVRSRILGDLEAGRIRVLCSVDVITEGWDCPPASCGILARPTMSLRLYLQMVGRLLRPFTDKTDALILDHAGCTLQHGFAEEDREWSLTMDEVKISGPRIDLNVNIPKVCPSCLLVAARGAKNCKRCGYKFATIDRRPDQVEGTLEEVGAGRKGSYYSFPLEARKTLFFRWSFEEQTKGYRPGYAMAKYRGCFGCEPEQKWLEVVRLSRTINQSVMGEASHKRPTA